MHNNITLNIHVYILICVYMYVCIYVFVCVFESDKSALIGGIASCFHSGNILFKTLLMTRLGDVKT